MTKSDGKNNIDSLEVVELEMGSHRTGQAMTRMTIKAVYALINSVTGDRYGSGTFATWSEETTAKINELLKSMEIDICSVVFAESTTTNGSEEAEVPQGDVVPSL